MDKTLVVVVIVLIAGVGVYIAGTNLISQYAIEPGGSNAELFACAPEQPTMKINQPVKFTSSIAEGIPYYWSAPNSTSSFVTSGPLTAKYSQIGTKTAYLFYVINDRWYRTSCSVQIK